MEEPETREGKVDPGVRTHHPTFPGVRKTKRVVDGTQDLPGGLESFHRLTIKGEPTFTDDPKVPVT